MSAQKWLISGVGRSGTTLVYNLLQSAMGRSGEKLSCFYEPYLWGPKTWSQMIGKNRDLFASTDCLHAFGIYVHTETEIFSTERTPLHDQFAELVFGGEDPRLCKVIRGAGRLRQFLEYDPDVKILHLVRNPLDVINSALKYFCLFGDEFHASDRVRFGEEIRRKYNAPVDDILCLSEAEQSLLWWKYLNEAAAETARTYPDRVLVAPYECLVHAPGRFLSVIGRFLDVPRDVFSGFDMARPAGPVTSEQYLCAEDVEKLSAECDAYLRNLPALSGNYFDSLSDDAITALYEKYENVKPGAYVRPVKSDISPLLSIHALKRVRSCLDIDANRQESLTPDYLARRVETVAGRNMENFQHLNEFLDSCSKLTVSKNKVRIKASNLLGGLENSRVLKTIGPAGAKIRNQIGVVRSQIGMLYDEAPLTCIVTSYNNGEYLRGTVESVFAQSRPPSRILIADDGSNDGSRDLIRSLEAEFHTVKAILREENVGPGMNRHLAILAADTPYITQLDGDDRIFPEKFEAEMGILDTYPQSIAYSDHVIACPSGFLPMSTEAFGKYESPAKRIEVMFSRETPLPHNMIYSKNLYVEAGGYDTSARLYEDWSLKLRLARCAKAWRWSRAKGLIYNKLEGGISSSNAEIHLYWQLYVVSGNLDWLGDILSPQQIIKNVSEFSKFIVAQNVKKKYEGALSLLSSDEAGLSTLARALSSLSAKKCRATTVGAAVGVIDEFIVGLHEMNRTALQFDGERSDALMA